MSFLKKLFGSSASRAEDRDGIYFYIRSDRTGEVIRLRLHRYNDLSDEGGSFYVRKIVVGQSSFDRIETQLFFDKRRQLINSEIDGGELVDRDAYDAYRASRKPADGGEN